MSEVLNVDLALLREVVEDDFSTAIEAEYGAPGMTALRVLAPALDMIHEQLAYELIVDGLTVLVGLAGDYRPLSVDESIEISPGQLPQFVAGGATIQVLATGRLLLLPRATDPMQYADEALVYSWQVSDYFVIAGQLRPVRNPTSFPSIWGTPTFFELDAALTHYRDNIAPYCMCPHLENVWDDPGRRWLLKNKPEATFQECLYYYFHHTIRGYEKIEIRREQPAGGLKPPDLKITWSLTSRIAYVEVKWMGASVHATQKRISWEPGEKEATDGAAQLAGYLDSNRPEALNHQTKGYLAVFDCRREGIEYGTTSLTSDQANYFRTREVNYAPDYASTRNDFAPPYRFFLLPLEPSS